MKSWSLTLMMAVALCTNAQNFPSEVWYEGKVVLVNQEVYKGLVKYDLETDIIQLNANNTIQAFSSKKILYFEIYDEAAESFRQFYALPYTVSPGYKTPILFEVLHEGAPLTLLARENITTETVPTYNYYYGRNNFYSRYRLVYQYYFLNEKGRIDRYTQKKSDLMHIMGKKSSEVRKFIKENNLRVDRRRDLERITAFYNSLLES